MGRNNSTANEQGLKEMGHIRKKYVGKLSELMGSDSLVSKRAQIPKIPGGRH